MRVARILPLAVGIGRVLASTANINTNTNLDNNNNAGGDVAQLAERGVIDDIIEDIKDGASCAGCETLVVLLKGIALLGDKVFVKTIQDICKLANAEDDDVCEGAVALEGPVIAEAIRNMKVPSQTSKLFCINFLGVCDYPKITPFEVPFPSSAADKPSAGLERPKPSGKTPLKVVHYSDVHIDHMYVAGSSANCTKPICCRPYTADDEPGVSDSPAGPNGDHNCDTPVNLAESMYAAINEFVPDAAFTICTGDIVDHTVWNTSFEYNEYTINHAYAQMASSLGLVYGTIGNHEAHPTNLFASKSVDDDQATWVYNLVSAAWGRWIGAEAASSTRSQGSYSVKYPGPASASASDSNPKPKSDCAAPVNSAAGESNLRIISLNTNMYYTQNYYLYQRTMETDPDDQLAWLAAELDAAEKAGERVYIIGHMPPGDHNAFRDQSHYLDEIFNRYAGTIAAMFYGHTHRDEFQITYADYAARSADGARVMSYIAPSLTPTSGMPSFRVYLVDPDTFAVLDAETYIADMDDPTFQTSPVPKWKKYYSAKEAYGPLASPPVVDPAAELTPAFWHSVTEAFERDQDAFDAYYLRKSRGWKAEDTCSGVCRELEVCGLRAARAENNCYEPEPGVNFKKRSADPVANKDDCGVSVVKAAIGALALRRDAVQLIEKRYVESGAARLA